VDNIIIPIPRGWVEECNENPSISDPVLQQISGQTVEIPRWRIIEDPEINSIDVEDGSELDKEDISDNHYEKLHTPLEIWEKKSFKASLAAA